MKKLIILAFIVFGLIKTSAGTASKKNMTEKDFQKALRGTWIAACREDKERNEYYNGLLTFSPNNRGNMSYLVYAQPNCQGPLVKKHNSYDFTYAQKEASGNTVIIEKSLPDGRKFIANIVVTRKNLTSTMFGTAIDYQRYKP